LSKNKLLRLLRLPLTLPLRLPLTLLLRLMPLLPRLTLLLRPLLMPPLPLSLTLPRLPSKKRSNSFPATNKNGASAPFLFVHAEATDGRSHRWTKIYCSCCCSRERIRRAVSERSTPPSLVSTCTVELLPPLLLT